MNKNQYIFSLVLLLVTISIFFPFQYASAQKKGAKHPKDNALRYSYQSLEKWRGSKFSEPMTFFERSYLSFGTGVSEIWGISELLDGSTVGISSNVSFGHWIAPIHGLEMDFRIGVLPNASWELDYLEEGYYNPCLNKYWSMGLTYMANLSLYASRLETPKRWELIAVVGVNLMRYEKYSIQADIGMRLQYNLAPSVGIYAEPSVALFDNKLNSESANKFTVLATPSISVGFSVHFNKIHKYSKQQKTNSPTTDKPKKTYPSLNIKTNMLYWVAYAPNIGLEYRFRNHWSIGVSATAAWWKNQATHKYYQIGLYELEGRLYIGKSKHHHLGTYIQGGMYDLEFNKVGKMGEFIGVGISYGYLLPISDRISFDFEIGFGYTNTLYKEYQYVETVNVYEYLRTSRSHLFAPSRIGVSLIWSLPIFKTKGGSR